MWLLVLGGIQGVVMGSLRHDRAMACPTCHRVTTIVQKSVAWKCSVCGHQLSVSFLGIANLVVVTIGLGVVGLMVLSSKSESAPLGDGFLAPRPVIEQFSSLKDGEYHTWPLPPGTYSITVTATNDGISVEWIGGQCENAKRETRSFSGTCNLPRGGQLVLTNPTLLGLGQSTQINVVVMKE